MDLDQNWQLAADPRDQEIEELIAAGLPSPLMPSPFMVAVDGGTYFITASVVNPGTPII